MIVIASLVGFVCAMLGFVFGWLLCSAFAAGKREDDNKAFGMLQRGYQRRVERAYKIGYWRGFRHGTPLSVKELLDRWKAEGARQCTEPATLLTGTGSTFGSRQPAPRTELAGE